MTDRCYFAHHITDYDSPREQAALEAIVRHGFEPENPNTPENEAAYQALKARGENPMAHFDKIVRACGALAFLRFESGDIGAGVGKEIVAAAETGLPVYEIVNDELTVVDGLAAAANALSVEETRAKLHAIRSAN